MRTYINGMMEDMGTPIRTSSSHTNGLCNHSRGRPFVSMRPIGHQVNEVLVDNAH